MPIKDWQNQNDMQELSLQTRPIRQRKAKNRLFLVCPECALESKVRQHFEGEAHFLSALAGVFQAPSYANAEKINDLIGTHDIEEICIINDDHCAVTQNVVTRNLYGNTRAEEVLERVFQGNPKSFARTKGKREKCNRLAQLNILREALQLRDMAYIGSRIEEKEIRLRGFIYDRKADYFEETATRF